MQHLVLRETKIPSKTKLSVSSFKKKSLTETSLLQKAKETYAANQDYIWLYFTEAGKLVYESQTCGSSIVLCVLQQQNR